MSTANLKRPGVETTPACGKQCTHAPVATTPWTILETAFSIKEEGAAQRNNE
jgi:hypothetical protein